MNAYNDLMAEANGRALTAFLRAMGGQAVLHAKDFGMSQGECSKALHRLMSAGLVERTGECEWRLTA